MSKVEDLIPGGLADQSDIKDFNPASVEAGKKVELEHTDDPKIAREIATDHLKEDPKYYQKLKEIEKCGDELSYLIDPPDKADVAKGRRLARRMKLHGMDISIETDKGQHRHWYDPHNDTEGSTKMKYPYGYVRRTVGADDEHIDVYVGPNHESTKVFVIRQNKAPDFKEYDEDKVMLGFNSAKEAKEAYLHHYNSPKFFGSMDTMSIDEFKNRHVNKAIGDSAPTQPNAQPPADQPADNQGQTEQAMQPMFDPYDMNIPQAVQQQLNSIGGMSDKEMMKLAQAVWGDGYQYRPIGPNQVRAELRGFLQDQTEWLQLNPMAQMLPEMGHMQMPPEMPHSSDLSQESGPGASVSTDLLNEKTLDGTISDDEKQNSYNDMVS